MKDITERKQIVDALAKSEALLREAQGVAHIGHWELDISIMTPAWSEEIFHIFGLDPEEGEPSFEAHQKVTHPDDWGILNNAVTTSIAEGIPFDIEFRILLPDKTIRWMHAIGYPRKDSEGRIISVFGTAQDITDRKLMEDVLRESEEKYRLLVENANEALYVLQDGIFRYANRVCSEMLGVPVAELIGLSMLEFLNPDDREKAISKHLRILRGELAADRTNFRVLTRHGEERWADVNSVVIAWDGKTATLNFATDITDRKQAEDALRESEERHRSILHTAMDGIWLTDTQGRLLDVNEAYCQMSGYSTQELLAMRITDLNAGKTSDEGYANIQKVMALGEYRFETRHRRKDGSIYDVEISAQYRPDDGRQFVAFLRDITERKRVEEALRQSEENFRRSLDDSPLGVRIVTVEGETIYANRVILDIYGYDSIEELNTTPVKKRYSPESYAEFQGRREKRKQGDYGLSEYEVSIIRKNGDVRQLRVFPKSTT